MGEHEITTAGPLLDADGRLREPGWARQPLLAFDPQSTGGALFRRLRNALPGRMHSCCAPKCMRASGRSAAASSRMAARRSRSRRCRGSPKSTTLAGERGSDSCNQVRDGGASRSC